MEISDAFEQIAQAIASAAAAVTTGWDECALQTRILAQNCSGMSTSVLQGGKATSVPLEMSQAFAVNDAVLLLRDDLLRRTAARIWGLQFTLYPDGKFEIEYDYNKPEDYEESEETIELSEALERLRNMGANVTLDDPKKKQE